MIETLDMSPPVGDEGRARSTTLAHALPSDRRPAFCINGRFLTQPVTGVQRYAREVVNEIDLLIADRPFEAELIMPAAPIAIPGHFHKIQSRLAKPLHGHLWEQTVLPSSCATPLLCLCNVAPLLADRTVVCIHDTNVFSAAQSYSRAFGAVYRRLLPRIARSASFLTTVSETAAEDLAHRLNLPLRSLWVVPNGHEHALRWRADRSAFTAAVGNWRPYILVVGSLAPHKNVGRILDLGEALARLGLEVVVAGTAQGPFSTMSQADAANVRYLGRVTDDDLACLMDHALCLAFPSRQEGFGIPVVEAMARGCPVVASDASSLPEVCGGAALLADPDVGMPWLRHFERLSASCQLREELRQRGRDNVRRFSWRASAEAYLELLLRA